MKVIFLHRVWPVYGGGETVTICLANEMVRRDIEVHVAYFKDSATNGKSPFIDARIVKHRIDGIQFNELSSDFYINKRDATIASSELIAIIKQHNIDVVNNQWWPVEFLHEVKQKTGAKIIKTLHMDVDLKKAFDTNGIKGCLYKIIYPLYRYLERKKNIWRANKYYNNSDVFVFLAPCFLKTYAKLTNKSPNNSKLDYVYNPLVFESSISPIERKNKENIVLVVGRLSERHKKILRILESWKTIEQEKSLDKWKLQIVGDGEDRNLYEKEIKKKHLQRVEMIGYKQPLSYYKRAKIFLMTSAYEGFAMTLVEAQQNAVTLLVMDSYESLHEIVQDGYNGILVQDGNVKEFTEKLKILMKDSGLRDKLADKGLITCQRFVVSKVVDKWIKIYNK